MGSVNFTEQEHGLMRGFFPSLAHGLDKTIICAWENESAYFFTD